MLMTDRSNEYGAWSRKTSSAVKPCSATIQATKPASEATATTTPLGTPVDPDVYMTYAGRQATGAGARACRSDSTKRPQSAAAIVMRDPEEARIAAMRAGGADESSGRYG